SPRRHPGSATGTGRDEGKKFPPVEISLRPGEAPSASMLRPLTTSVKESDRRERSAVSNEQAVGRVPLGKRKRRPEDALPHSVNHWIRVEILAILNEGEFSAGEIARMLGEDVKNVRPHLLDLYRSGCVEFAGHKMVAGSMRPVYRALVLPVV